jgi:ATP-dependent helicase YprA (DUF1998 family)
VDAFLHGCEDRPDTIGPSTSSTSDTHFPVVKYVSGWKRRPTRRERNKSAVSAAKKDEERVGMVEASAHQVVVEKADTRESSIVAAASLFAALVKHNLRTLAFCKVRKNVELVLKYALRELEETAPHLKELVASYRGGYTKKDRRSIEADLFSGKLIGVTATCALELGIDLVDTLLAIT